MAKGKPRLKRCDYCGKQASRLVYDVDGRRVFTCAAASCLERAKANVNTMPGAWHVEGTGGTEAEAGPADNLVYNGDDTGTAYNDN